MAETTEESLRKALEAALIHVSELREAWERGIISEHDGKGGLRSNRNVEVGNAARAALALPATPSRVEYRVAWDWLDLDEQWVSRETDPLMSEVPYLKGFPKYKRRNIRIETRAVPEPGPWLPYQEDEKV